MSDYKLTKEAAIKGFGSIYYVAAPIDVSTGLLTEKNINHISTRDLVYARVKKGKEHSLCQNGSWVREGDLYLPKQNEIVLVRDSLVLKSPAKAVNAHRNGKEFFVNEDVAEEAKSQKDVLVLKNTDAVPTDRFGEDERTVWLFQDMAGDYGNFLKNECGISQMPFSFDNEGYIKQQGKLYANQLWRAGLGDYSAVDGNDRALDGICGARGVRGESTRVASAQKIPDDYTKKQLGILSKVLHSQGITGDLEKRILAALKG